MTEGWTEASTTGGVHNPVVWILDGYRVILTNTYPKYIQNRYGQDSTWLACDQDEFIVNGFTVKNWEWA